NAPVHQVQDQTYQKCSNQTYQNAQVNTPIHQVQDQTYQDTQ
ncbi:17096_t:CDS:2, partial [Racocetra fulgida]